MKTFLIILLLAFSTSVFAQKKVNVVYKKRQKIDLGALTIEGEIVSPGDFSVEDEKGKESKMLFRRRHYKDRILMNIEFVM